MNQPIPDLGLQHMAAVADTAVRRVSAQMQEKAAKALERKKAKEAFQQAMNGYLMTRAQMATQIAAGAMQQAFGAALRSYEQVTDRTVTEDPLVARAKAVSTLLRGPFGGHVALSCVSLAEHILSINGFRAPEPLSPEQEDGAEAASAGSAEAPAQNGVVQ